jgi:hypothetical protein
MDKSSSFSSSLSMRDNYEVYGVDTYYRNVAASYRNPHYQGVKAVIYTALDIWWKNEHSPQVPDTDTQRILDMAAGSGEVTEAILSWGEKKGTMLLDVSATDPYTMQAYADRTQRQCQPLSFRDITDGKLPEESYTLVVCSFALHLVTDNSELFSLLWELSTKSKWFLVIAPGKRPHIKDGWGWRRWSWKTWDADTSESSELAADRSKGRLYRSTNC